MKFDFQGRIALITGGCGDIGIAIAEELRQAGARVAIGDLASRVQGRESKENLRFDAVDVTDRVSVDHWIESVAREWGTPDIVALNAAIVEMGSAAGVSDEAWRRTLDVNLTGAFNVAQSAADRMMKANTKGNIVAVGSWAAHAPHAGLAAYSVAKAGLRMYCKCLALELAPKGIVVNELAPGFVDAGLSAEIWRKDPEMKERNREQPPNRTLVEAQEVARMVALLCSPEARHLVGTVVTMDGGLSLLQGPR